MPIQRFDSIDAFLATNPSCNAVGEWVGGLTSNQIRQYAREGYAPLMERAERLLDQIEASTTEVTVARSVRSEFGPRLAMGEWLAGSPTCFRRRKKVVAESEPIGIYICTTSSAAISAEQMEARGAAVIALLMKLQTNRAVDLYLVDELGSYHSDGYALICTRVESRPLNLSQSSFAVGHVAFARGLTYGYANEFMQFDGGWPNGKKLNHYTEKDSYQSELRNLLNISENDLYIGHAHYNDAILKDPIAWINNQLARFSGAAESESE